MFVSGRGDVLRLNVTHFPTDSVDIADVLVLVGGVEAEFLHMETVVTLSRAVFFITLPEGRSLGRSVLSRVEPCSISLWAALSCRAGFKFTYIASHSPELTYTSKTRSLRRGIHKHTLATFDRGRCLW